MLRSSVGLVELREIFLTHFHADHFLGLPGMLKTFALRGRELPITIYGPPGLSDLFGDLRRVFGRLTYPYELVTLRPGDVLARDEYRIEAFAPNHGRNAVGYALVEEPRPGRFDPDAAEGLGIPIGPERGALQRRRGRHASGRARDHARLGGRRGASRTQGRARGRHRPCCECRRGGARRGRPRPRGDVHARRSENVRRRRCTRPRPQAAEAAREADVVLLALTHLSSRYFGPEIAEEARAIFPETVVPRDFDVIEVPFAERGSPRLVKGGASGRRVTRHLPSRSRPSRRRDDEHGAGGGCRRRHRGGRDSGDPRPRRGSSPSSGRRKTRTRSPCSWRKGRSTSRRTRSRR